MVVNNLKFSPKNITTINSYARRMNDELSGDDIGYYHLPSLGVDMVGRINELFRCEFDSVVLVGVGGSSLGVKALYDMLNLQKELIFLDNLDPYSIEKKCAKIDPSKTLFIISSKSGTTIETISIYKYILAKFAIKSYENFIFITDPDSPLESFLIFQRMLVEDLAFFQPSGLYHLDYVELI